jgi:hypothetical protein
MDGHPTKPFSRTNEAGPKRRYALLGSIKQRGSVMLDMPVLPPVLQGFAVRNSNAQAPLELMSKFRDPVLTNEFVGRGDLTHRRIGLKRSELGTACR